MGSFDKNKTKLCQNGIFTNHCKINKNSFQMGRSTNLEGSGLNNQQKRRVHAMLLNHQQGFSRNSNDLEQCDKYG